MKDEKKIQGFWFLPSNTEEKVAGIFTYSRMGGCQLEIVDQQSRNILGDSKIDIIHGISEDGISITLLECRRESGRSNSKGVTIVKLLVHFTLLGKHYGSETEIEFNKLQASLTDLGTWVDIFGFSNLEIKRISKLAIDLKYQLPDEITYPVSVDIKVGFDFDVSYTWNKESPDAEIHQKVFAIISSENCISFRDLLSYFFTYYKFLSLSYYDTPPLLSLFFQHSVLKSELNEDYPLRVELLYKDNFYNGRYKEEKFPYDFLFGYTDMKEIFPSVINKWFELFDKLAPSVNLLNELLMKRGLPVEIQFLTAIQAVETFHRNFYGGEATPKIEHEKRLEVILKCSPPEHKTWLKEKLAFSNEPTLRYRLTDICDRLPEKIRSELVKELTTFIAAVVDTRNYYTHYSSHIKAKNKVMRTKEQFTAIQKLKIFLIASILHQLGFDEKQVIEAIKFHIVYPYYDG